MPARKAARNDQPPLENAPIMQSDPADWIWLLYCQRTLKGDAFLLMQRARHSRAIRRSADPVAYREADVRALLASLGESAERIDSLVADARQRLRSTIDN
jgi:hypothetical protein